MAKVFVGLSGGVDSAASALLLKEQGHDVVGAFIKIWSPEFLECTWRDERLDTMRICAALSIPFREVDLSAHYRAEVVESMLEAYRSGITPNPDVLCNERIKFGHFARWAFENGADRIATGHYAQIGYDSDESMTRLLRGADISKDQSYFLHRVSSGDLARTHFPVGSFQKPHVRDIARRFNLPVAEKRDSQGLCFVGAVSMRDFLKRFIPVKGGPVLDEHGSIVGKHEGALLYTIGQRHGFTISGSAHEMPHFISAIDVEANSLTVTGDPSSILRTRVTIRDMHWIGMKTRLPFHTSVQTRYRDAPVGATIATERDALVCTFDTPHPASPGQSIVMYDSDRCLGGGVISPDV